MKGNKGDVLNIPTEEELDAAMENIASVLPKPEVVINDDLTFSGTLVIDDEPVGKTKSPVTINIDTTTYKQPIEKPIKQTRKKKTSTFDILFKDIDKLVF